MKYDELEKLVEEIISEESNLGCMTVGDCYRKIKRYFKQREGEDVLASEFDKFISQEIKSGNIDRTSFNDAWNQLVDAGDMWSTRSGNKKVYVYSPSELESALKIIAKDYAYEVSGNSIITRHETDEERNNALIDLTKKLARLGYVHSPRGGSLGRLELTSGGRGGVYIYFKWAEGAEKGGARAAAAGMGKEVELAEKIIEALGGDPEEMSQFVKTAGAGHGSDLQIDLPGEKPLNIEVKTSIGADFGQFKFGYDMNQKRWVPIKTKEWYKGKEALFMGIWENQVLPKLPKNPFRGINISNSPLNVKDGVVRGISTSLTTSEVKQKLAKKWFAGKESVYADYNVEDLAKYYSNKGDGYVQISRSGLYGLTNTYKKALNLDYTFLEAMREGSVSAKVRIRIKAHGGANETHSFTAALKVSGKIPKSNIDLDTPEGITKLLTILQTQNEDLTNSRDSYNILADTIEEVMSEE